MTGMRLFWRFLYPTLYSLGLILYALWAWLVRRHGEKKPAPWRERAGALPGQLIAPADGRRPRLWIHAVSVGEVNVVQPLVERLRLDPPQLFISTTTTTGQRVARRLYGDRATVFYFPLDWRFSCRRYLNAVRPDVVALTETEMWPGFLQTARQHGVRLALINGRLSDRSFARYRRVATLLRPLLESFDRFCMQSRVDKERILELGAPRKRVHQMGNLKYDYRLAEDADKERLVEGLRRLLKPDAADLLWVCGSTREKEEAMLLPVFARLRERFPQLRLLAAPRHPHRGAEVAALASGAGWTVCRRSLWSPEPNHAASPDVFVLDSIGELAYVYAIADAVFVGGSLVPWGGHNIIEAAHFSRPILFGPHVQNFREITDTFLERYAALQVRTPDELGDKLAGLLEDAAARRWLGRNARKVIRDNQGAVERTAGVIEQLLELNSTGSRSPAD